MTRNEELQTTLLSTLSEAGRVRPAELVRRVSERAHADSADVREALRVLVDGRRVDLNWHGEFQRRDEGADTIRRGDVR
jgi:hypothetical protein